MRVTFLYQDPHDRGTFYARFSSLMKVVADSLGIHLETIRCADSAEQIRAGMALCARDKKPDYLILTNTYGAGKKILQVASEAGIKVFVTPEGFSQLEKSAVGTPLGKYSEWIGELVSDERQAGHALAVHLLDQAWKKNLAASDGKVHLLGLAGELSAPVPARLNGLKEAAEEHRDRLFIEDVVPAVWDEGTAARVVEKTLRKNPEIAVIWAARDQLALGAVIAVKRRHKVPGQEILVGGIDWTPMALRSVRRGEIVASIGGQVTDGMFALILLYDHFHNVSMKPTSMTSQLTAATSSNADSFLKMYDESRLRQVSFSLYSKAMNPSMKSYSFSAASLLKHLS